VRAVVASLCLALATFAACGDNDGADIVIVVPAAWEPQITELVARIPASDIRVVTGEAAASHAIILGDDATIPTEGFRLGNLPHEVDSKDDNDGLIVSAHDVLGAQYGVSAALEAYGFRFRHPYDTYVPTVRHLRAFDPTTQSPAIKRRGFQFHTLHPIEPYFAFWEPSADNLEDAKRIVDWTIKNRGNYVMWVALNNIEEDPSLRPDWMAHENAIIDYAHSRGVEVALNLQLFGQSNLQLAFDLSRDKTNTIPIHDEVASRLPIITTQGVKWDVYHLSFGEFFNSDPDKFVAAVNEVHDQLKVTNPEAELHGYVHVGAAQRIDYMGENLIYYFLVKFTNPEVIPDIHSVMFFNLFENTNGAYQSQYFNEHLDYLRERMCDSKPVSYVPEDAYWIAFDDSLPQFYPLYVRSRLHDLQQLRAEDGPCGTLPAHILFSSGWEWGYWLNDVTALRASYKLPASARDAIAEQYAPDMGPDVANVIDQLQVAQHQALMTDNLVGYFAGRDSVIDLGRTIDIISQPDRITFDQLAMPGVDLDAFEQMLMPPLERYIATVDGLQSALHGFSMDESRWSRELLDGIDIDVLRAKFVHASYIAALASIRGDKNGAEQAYGEANDILADAHIVIDHRHNDLHDTHGRRLLEKSENATSFQFGYLYFANNLCYWQRELEQLDNLLHGTSGNPPSCFYTTL
jgi:hypothetical protein